MITPRGNAESLDSDRVRIPFHVMLELSTDAWAMNYGLRDEEIQDDMLSHLPEAIVAAIEGWITKTGNLGQVSVYHDRREAGQTPQQAVESIGSSR